MGKSALVTEYNMKLSNSNYVPDHEGDDVPQKSSFFNYEIKNMLDCDSKVK